MVSLSTPTRRRSSTTLDICILIPALHGIERQVPDKQHARSSTRLDSQMENQYPILCQRASSPGGEVEWVHAPRLLISTDYLLCAKAYDPYIV